MTVHLDMTSMLGCRVRLDDFEHEGKHCVRLSLDVDTRHAEVLLSDSDLVDISFAMQGAVP